MSFWLPWKRGMEMAALVAIIAAGSWLISIATAGIIVMAVGLVDRDLGERLVDPLSMIAVAFFFPFLLGSVLNSIDQTRTKGR